MSIFLKIKQFFSGSQPTQLDEDVGIVAPYKVEMPVLIDVVAAPTAKPAAQPAVKKAPAKKQQFAKKAVTAGPAAMKVPAVRKPRAPKSK